ncbi:MAG: hypothetical protein MUC90_06100 [Thermoplasmata archaeon]|jgi:hypothetical protein|nr:hypothetical protein [Thermoplasmata archaeon]
MKLIEMKTKCRMCGKELIADTKDESFVSFYCMKCGIYTTRPLEEFKDEPKPAPATPAPATPAPQAPKP